MQNIELLDKLLQNTQPKPYFVTIYGYEKRTMDFLTNFYINTMTNGLYIKDSLQNPTSDEVQDFLKHVNQNPTFTKEEITSYLGYLDIKEKVASAVLQVLSTEEFSANQSIRKNAYIKMMCWIKNKFLNVLRQENPNILFEGFPAKYEKYFLDLLFMLGANIVIVDFLCENGHVGKNIIVCDTFGKPLIHFENSAKNKMAHKEKQASTTATPVANTPRRPSFQINRSAFCKSNDFFDGKDVFTAILDTNYRDGQNVYAYVEGAPADDYEIKLFDFKLKLTEQNRKVIIVEGNMQNPTVSETQMFRDVDEMYTLRVNFLPKIELNSLGTNAILDVIENQPVNKQKNLGITMLCWLYRHKEMFKSKHPVFILFNGKKTADILFLRVLKHMGVDVLLINPNKEIMPENCYSDVLNIIGELSLNITEYPKTRTKMTSNTVASSAENELHDLLYNNTGFYRDRQFKTAKSITLKTTFDEISILWNVESAFRPHFETNENVVSVPNIFAKISGIENADKKKYVQFIRKFKINNALIFPSYEFGKIEEDAKHFMHKEPTFIKNNRLQIEEVMKDSQYKYSHVHIDTQHFILQKIDELLYTDIIDCERSKLNKIILGTLLSLSREILQLIQGFDFTKVPPKILILDTDESMPSIENIVIMMFLNLLGFDILLFTPTGYQNIEKYLKTNIVAEHVIGPFEYSINAHNLMRNINLKQGIMSKIFGK